MEDSFIIPARPWGEAEVKFLVANADLLDEETRNELGLGPVVAEETEDAEETTEENLGTTTVGEAATEPVTVTETTVTPTTEGGLPTDADGAVVDNPTTDNA